MKTTLYRGVQVYLDKRSTVEIMDAVQGGSTSSMQSAVIRAMEKNSREAWWSTNGTDSSGAGRWWSSSYSTAAGYAGGWLFWGGTSYYGISVILSIGVEEDEWNQYADVDGQGTYWYRIPAGLPLTITQIDARPPTRDQVAEMVEEIAYQEDVVSRFGGKEEPSFANPEGGWVKMSTSIRTQSSDKGVASGLVSVANRSRSRLEPTW